MYTSSAIPTCMAEDATRGKAARPKSLRVFGRTGGASSDAQSRRQQVSTAALPLKTRAQLPRSPVLLPEANGQAP